MIRRGTENDKKAIFDLYTKSSMLNLDRQDDYFVNGFDSSKIIVNEVNGHVVSSIQMNEGVIMLHQKRIACGIATGLFYERTKGAKWFENLKQEVFDQQQYQNLITIIPTEHPEEFYKYGFEDIYKQRLYTINKNDFENSSFAGVGKNFKIDELYEIYKQFIVNFDGYLIRDRQYYSDLVSLIQKKKYNLALYHDQNNQALGYMIYYIEASKVVVKEIMYLNGLALTRLICYGLRLKNNVHLYVSANEDLSKAFPKIKYKLLTSAVARINDFSLFQKLYHLPLTNSQEGFKKAESALYFNDLNY